MTTAAIAAFCQVEPAGSGNRLNDGRCDARGRFWIGSMDNGLSRPSGSFTATWSSTDPVSGASGPLTPALVAELLADRIYLNIHTLPNFPSGELRGQLVNQGSVGLLSGTGGVRNVEVVDRSLFYSGFED